MAKGKQHSSTIKYAQSQAGLYAAREGRALRKWDNNWNPGGAQGGAFVSDQEGLIYNLEAGEQVIIFGWYFGVSFDDSCQFQIGVTDQADGAGTFTALAGARTQDKDATYHTGCRENWDRFDPPLRARYSEGARCVTIKVILNGTNPSCNMGWEGILEAD